MFSAARKTVELRSSFYYAGMWQRVEFVLYVWEGLSSKLCWWFKFFYCFFLSRIRRFTTRKLPWPLPLQIRDYGDDIKRCRRNAWLVINTGVTSRQMKVLSLVKKKREPVAYPGIFFGCGGSTNSVEDRGQRERGSGVGSPLVRSSGGNCNLVQEISFHMVTFSSFLVL